MYIKIIFKKNCYVVSSHIYFGGIMVSNAIFGQFYWWGNRSTRR